jgi:ribosomal protein S18 acetylase RimI-like enzyme
MMMINDTPEALGNALMKIDIRRAVQGDYRALAGLFREVHDYHAETRPDLFQAGAAVILLEKDFTEKVASPDEVYLVAKTGEQIAGFVHVVLKVRPSWSSFAASADISAVSVTQTMRGQGIGRKLLAAAEAWALEKDATYLTLGVHTFNVEGQNLYRSAGFEVESLKMAKFIKPSLSR